MKTKLSKTQNFILTNFKGQTEKTNLPGVMVGLLEDEYGTDFKRLQQRVAAAAISATTEQIEDFAGDKFEPYVYEYFQRNVAILKDKAGVLLDLIDKIAQNDTQIVQPQLQALDINLKADGQITTGDLLRLVAPTIYNINTMDDYVKKANRLSTYLTTNFSKAILYQDGLTEADIYPNQTLQINDLNNDNIDGNVPLSHRQIQAIQQKNGLEILS